MSPRGHRKHSAYPDHPLSQYPCPQRLSSHPTISQYPSMSINMVPYYIHTCIDSYPNNQPWVCRSHLVCVLTSKHLAKNTHVFSHCKLFTLQEDYINQCKTCYNYIRNTVHVHQNDRIDLKKKRDTSYIRVQSIHSWECIYAWSTLRLQTSWC